MQSARGIHGNVLDWVQSDRGMQGNAGENKGNVWEWVQSARALQGDPVKC